MGQMDAALQSRVAAQFAESANLKLSASQPLSAPVARAGALLAETLRQGGKALACGNGGSAADSQHFAAEPVSRFGVERAPLPALALPTSTSTPRSIPNEYA